MALLIWGNSFNWALYFFQVLGDSSVYRWGLINCTCQDRAYGTGNHADHATEFVCQINIKPIPNQWNNSQAVCSTSSTICSNGLYICWVVWRRHWTFFIHAVQLLAGCLTLCRLRVSLCQVHESRLSQREVNIWGIYADSSLSSATLCLFQHFFLVCWINVVELGVLEEHCDLIFSYDF